MYPRPEIPNCPPPNDGLWYKITRLVFHLVAPIGATGLFVVLFDGGGHVIAFVGPFLGVTVLQEALLWLFHFARRMGAESYEILRK